MIFRSPHDDVEIPDKSLSAFVLEHAAERGDKPALIDGPTGRTITYAQLAGGAQKLAAGLAERGFSKGDVFAIFSPNVPEYALAFHGIATAGGIATTVNPLYTVDELTFQLENSKAKYLLTIPQFLDRAREAADKAGVEEVFVLGEAEGATPFASLLGGDAAPPKIDFDPANDLVVMPYSSGTTGLPKGVMLTHRNLVANVCQSIPPQSTDENDVVIGVLPFFHIYGMTVIMNIAIRVGATVVTMPKFDLEEFLTLMQDHKVTRAYLVPPIILALAKHPIVEKYDLSNLEVIMSGAAPLGHDLQEAAQDRVGGVVMQGYGLTETSPVTHMNPDEKGKGRAGSIGFLIPNTEAKFVDPAEGKELDVNGTGELLIRGPQVMKGYLNNDEATKITIDDDGWLHTGDIGYVDQDGYFFLVDRLKELIKYKGFQVPPAELEAVLLSHPAVADAAVIPVPDEEAGEIPKAYVVLKEKVDDEEIMGFVAERVAPYKKIRLVEVIDEIPKSASGKILRRVLVDKERAAAR
ncbi:MAG TPA: 4-coumarate--CoA ligase family protein [Actinomycetota bacterium]|nr:4-coumarate--CoA ligase family protein [Actinomycetota bacterium]